MYAPPIPTRAPPQLVHTVKAGETLASIAARYHVKVEDLRRWNTIGRLTAGQKLRVQSTSGTAYKPLVAKKKAPAKGKPKPTPSKHPLRKAA
jgi:LysM repeat protein